MSVESTFKNYIDINLQSNQPLQPTVSQREHIPATRRSLKSASKEHYRRDRSKPRTRTFSISAETSAELDTELPSSNKHDKRQSESKPTVERRDHTPVERHDHTPVERHNHTPVDRRYSTPQLHLSTLFPYAFRNPKHHHKTNTKDEINATNNIPNNGHASLGTSSNHFTDVTTMKADPAFTLKMSTSPAIGSRLISSNSSERLLSTHNEDSITSSTFILEKNTSEPRSTELLIIESHTPICVSEIYHEHFYEYFHANYYGEFDYEGPFIASLRCINQKTSGTDICEARAIIRTPYCNCNVSSVLDGANENNIFQMLLSKGNLPTVRTFGPIGDPKANEKIYLFDKTNDERYSCKIGVIYQRTHQIDEYEIFSNDYLSDEMFDFLEMLADRVRLKGFPKYRGDLDTKDNLHGEYSYYTVYENHEIMFNVAPLVPSTKANGQCIERKGLVGNAFVCIVFQETGAIFTPDFISGRVTQIYITVQPNIHEEELYYKIGIWRRNDIASVVDPSGGVYKCDKSFLPYFLTLLLNSVNIAIESPSLRSRVYEQRQRLKYEELKKLSLVFNAGPIPGYTADAENMYHQVDVRRNRRSESFSSNATVTTSDGGSTSFGRTSPVSMKKRGFSRKIFGVFSSLSGSNASGSVPPPYMNNDGVPSTPQTSSQLDGSVPSTRASISSNKELAKPPRSIKSTQAPILPPRPSNPQIRQGIAVQPPTPAIVSLNPLNPDSLTQNNLLNTSALDITPRNRSNSSPEDTAHTNKSQASPALKIGEDSSTGSSVDDESEAASSEDEKSAY